LPVQKTRIRADARAQGHRIVGWETDPAITGTVDEAGRPGIMAVLNAIRDGESQGLYITDLGRLSRLLTIQEAILAKVWQYGGHVITVESGEVMRDDPDDPMRTAMRQMAGVFFQLERSMIVKRLKAGREFKASIGGHSCGAPAFGLAAVDGELVPVESEREAIARMRELRGGGASLRDIASALESEGHRTKLGGSWHPATVARTLRRAAAGS
jgi:DNA invertase Pin-like site-specific DNA recombinase